jgi:hypothetical protein
MRKFVMVSPNFWVGQTGRDLRNAGQNAQLVALYLLSNPHANYTGLYRLPTVYIANDLGLSLDDVHTTLKAIEQTDFARYDHASEYVWIVEGARHQLGADLKPNDNKVKYVNKEFAAITKSCRFLRDYFNKYAASLHLQPRKDLGIVAQVTAALPPAPEVPALVQIPTFAEPVPTPTVIDYESAVDMVPTEIADCLSNFLQTRERSGGLPAGKLAVAKYVMDFAAKHGSCLVRPLLDAAASARDYDIVDAILYEQEVLTRYDI